MTGWAWVWCAATWVWMLFALWLLHSRPVRPRTLREVLTGMDGPRCACGRFWVPPDFTAVRDAYGRHEPGRCQPGQEETR